MNRAIGLLAAAAVCLASGCSVSPEAGLGMERPEFRAGDSRPVLKWESFPVEGDPIAEAHPTDVTYDLRVYHGDPWGRPLGPRFTSGAGWWKTATASRRRSNAAGPVSGPSGRGSA